MPVTRKDVIRTRGIGCETGTRKVSWVSNAAGEVLKLPGKPSGNLSGQNLDDSLELVSETLCSSQLHASRCLSYVARQAPKAENHEG